MYVARALPAAALGLFLACSTPLLAAGGVPATARGVGLLQASFRATCQRIADRCLTRLTTRAEWERQRAELRRQFLDMLGLWPLPPRTDLRATVTGKDSAEHFTIEKLHFQSIPGLYVTANLYIPKLTVFPAPTVLYLCGHAPEIIAGVSYGNKVHYQHHAVWFAEHGYVCLVLDTLQLGEVPGIHHGTYNHGMWWWQTLGYTPAGIECWNAICALDYLETRGEVDPQRIGVTGRSGGGATSWWLAAADERPHCIVPVAGIADLQAHVVEGSAPHYPQGVIAGHCDCMYFVNTYRWDFPLVAALCAPRPLLLGNSDADEIFPVPGYRRLAEKVRRVYDLYGAGDRFALLETAGPHKDTPELRLGAYRWMNRWLKGEAGDATEEERPRFAPGQLKVFDRTPEDAINGMVHETFIKPAPTELPQASAVARAWWAGKREEWLQELRDKVFRGWPCDPPALDPRPAGEATHNGLHLRAFDFRSEEGVDLRLWLATAEGVAAPKLVIVNVLDEPRWHDFAAELGPAFRKVLQLSQDPGPAKALQYVQDQKALETYGGAFAFVAPRGVGPTRWAESGTPADVQIRRRFPLLGQTLDSTRVWDVRRGLAVLRGLPELKGVPVWLEGHGDMAGIALYAALFEPEVARLDLWHPPASHRHGPTFLNVRRILDMPQAVALAFPRPVRLYVSDERDERAWRWPLELQRALGQEYLKTRRVGD
jgi:hypothetical protein